MDVTPPVAEAFPLICCPSQQMLLPSDLLPFMDGTLPNLPLVTQI